MNLSIAKCVFLGPQTERKPHNSVSFGAVKRFATKIRRDNKQVFKLLSIRSATKFPATTCEKKQRKPNSTKLLSYQRYGMTAEWMQAYFAYFQNWTTEAETSQLCLWTGFVAIVALETAHDVFIALNYHISYGRLLCVLSQFANNMHSASDCDQFQHPSVATVTIQVPKEQYLLSENQLLPIVTEPSGFVLHEKAKFQEFQTANKPALSL